MTDDDTRTANEELQFERVAPVAPVASESPATPGVVCKACNAPIQGAYFHVNSTVTCEKCKDTVVAAVSTPRGPKPLARSAGLGLVAAIAGAAIYYGVIALLDLEIGFIAILIGYMVGRAVRMGAGGRGGRRFQILAIVLTYWSVGLAYTPFFLKGLRKHEGASPSVSASDSSRAVAPDSSVAIAPASSGGTATAIAPAADQGTDAKMGLPLALLVMFFYVFALPIIVIIGGGMGGLLSALIIGIGLRQAWRMTGTPALTIGGPYRVATGPSPVAG